MLTPTASAVGVVLSLSYVYMQKLEYFDDFTKMCFLSALCCGACILNRQNAEDNREIYRQNVIYESEMKKSQKYPAKLYVILNIDLIIFSIYAKIYTTNR